MFEIHEIKQYWDRQPCNIKHSPYVVGSKEYFEDVTKRKYFIEPHIPQFAEFERWKGLEVLEIGSGIGTDSISFAASGAKLTVIELSEKSLEITKQRFKILGLEANFILANAEHLSDYVKEKKFDLVYSFGVIHHTPNPSSVIEEIKKVLKPGGELRIMLYATYSIKNFLIRLGFMQSEAQQGCPIALTYTAKEIRHLLSGFSIYSCRKDHIFPYNVLKYKKYIYEKRFPWSVMPLFLFRLVERLLGWHYLIKARKN